MSFDIARIHDSSRKVRKFFRKNTKRPVSGAVHNLRTSIRSLETAMMTLGLDSTTKAKRLLREMKAIRKRAGKVRDMDVLTANALSVKHSDGELDCLVRLLEYLGAERNRCAKKLRRVVRSAGPQCRRSLKRNSRSVEKLLKDAENNKGNSAAMPVTMAKTLQLSSELSVPARLTRANLHSYRLKVKELRNVLLLSDQHDGEFLEKLGDVKDAIGEWHDWEELVVIARHSLNHGKSCKLITQLKAIRDSRFEHALSLTNNLRSHYLQSTAHSHKVRRGNLALLSPPVLAATSAIAETRGQATS